MRNASRNLEWVIRLFAKREVLFLLFLAVLAVVSIIRWDIPAGEEFYYHSRIAEQILHKNLFYDNLSYGGRYILPSIGLDLIIAMFSFLTGFSVKTTSLILPILFGLGSLLLLYSLVRGANKKVIVLGFLFLLISPGFLYLFTRPNVYAATVFFTVLSIYFLSRNKHRASIMSFIPIFLISVPGGFVALFALLIYSAYIKNLRIWLKFLTTSVIVSLVYLPFLIKFGLPELPEFTIGNTGINFIFQRYIFDFGSKFGLGIFGFLLSFFGISKLMRDRQGHFVEHIGFIGLFALAYFFDAALLFLTFFVSILAAHGFIGLLKKRWQSRTIRYITLLIFIYGLLFSGLSYVNQSINGLPNSDIVNGLRYLGSLEEGTVFSGYTNGIWINAIAGKKNVMDSKFFYAPGVNYRWQDSQRILYSIDVEEISWLFNKYNVKYVFLDPDMKEKLFENRDTGLIYVLKYSNKFKRVYNKNGVEVWEYAS